ncbi:MAG: hypothetical protein M3273_00985 [Actinomycetota bacterium]|nr:hypothetical protein [Actinomycetota bacterium]
MTNEKETGKVRELFIEELAEVHGGTGNPLKELVQWVRDQLVVYSTMACCEEGPQSCC